MTFSSSQKLLEKCILLFTKIGSNFDLIGGRASFLKLGGVEQQFWAWHDPATWPLYEGRQGKSLFFT